MIRSRCAAICRLNSRRTIPNYSMTRPNYMLRLHSDVVDNKNINNNTMTNMTQGTIVDKYKSATNNEATIKGENRGDVKADCGDLKAIGDEEPMEQEDMFVEAHSSFEHSEREWGGPRRGGRLPEPTRFGDWERKGRCSDF